MIRKPLSKIYPPEIRELLLRERNYDAKSSLSPQKAHPRHFYVYDLLYNSQIKGGET